MVKTEIHESTLHSHERVYREMPNLQLGAEHAMENAEVGAIDRDCAGAGVGEPLGEDLIKIVGHFCFELERAIARERETSAEAGEVCVSLRQTEVIRKHANLDAIIFLGKGRWHSAGSKDEQNRE